MKKVKNAFLTILGLVLMASCHTNQPKSDIKLNNGEKWEVNAEMKPHIEKGSKLIREFISNEDQDYLKLAENLKAQNNALIQSCTMKGESHDELHKWLYPHIKLIGALSKADNSDAAKELISEIETSFETYTLYFQ